MKFAIYTLQDEKKQVIYQSDNYLMYDKKGGSTVDKLAKLAKKQNLSLSIFDVDYAAEQLVTIKVNVSAKITLYFLFLKVEDGQIYKNLINEIASLKELPSNNQSEIDYKVAMVFQIVEKYHPLFCFIDKYVPALESGNNTYPILMRANPKDKEESSYNKKRNNRFNFAVSSVCPLMVEVLFFLSLYFFIDKSYFSAVIILLLFIGESFIYTSFILTDLKNEKMLPYFQKNKIISLTSIGFFAVGFGVNLILGYFALSKLDNSKVLLLSSLSLLGPLVLCIIFAIFIASAHRKYFAYYGAENFSMKKYWKIIFAKKKKSPKKNKDDDDEYFHIDM